MTASYLQHFTPFQRTHLIRVCKRYWIKWSSALALVNGMPVMLALLANGDLFETLGFVPALLEILSNAVFVAAAFFPIFIILWVYLLYLLFKKIIPLQRDIKKGMKLMLLIPADKYKMEEFNQFFIRTPIKNYPFLKLNQWAYDQIEEGTPLLFESAPRSSLYLGLRSAVENEVILTENPESVY